MKKCCEVFDTCVYFNELGSFVNFYSGPHCRECTRSPLMKDNYYRRGG